MQRWMAKWIESSPAQFPDLETALRVATEASYPNIRLCMMVLLCMPVSTAIHSGEILLQDEASQNIPSQHHDHREAVRTRFIKHNIKTVKSTRSKWLMFLPAAKFTSTVMASTIVKYRSSLDIYQISVHIQCQILCEQCTCITNKVIIIKHVTLFTFHHWL